MEKRKFTRFRVQDDAYAALRGDFTKVGKIHDISLNGLAFRYFAKNECNKTFSHVDIFLANNLYHLADVPCTVVCDDKEPTTNSCSVLQFRCGLKFEGMNAQQQNKLENFINNYTTGTA